MKLPSWKYLCHFFFKPLMHSSTVFLFSPGRLPEARRSTALQIPSEVASDGLWKRHYCHSNSALICVELTPTGNSTTTKKWEQAVRACSMGTAHLWKRQKQTEREEREESNNIQTKGGQVMQQHPPMERVGVHWKQPSASKDLQHMLCIWGRRPRTKWCNLMALDIKRSHCPD